MLEPSLATRVVAYAIQLVAFTKHILFGCGFLNSEIFINPFYIKEAVFTLTPENYIQYSLKPYLVALSKSSVYTTLAELGIVGLGLYFLFIIKNYILCKKMSKIYYGIKRDFLKGLNKTFISIIFISFYNLGIEHFLIWLLYGVVLVYLYNIKNKNITGVIKNEK